MEELKRAEILKMEEEAKKQKIREKEALIDELMFAEGDAKEILNTFAQTVANKQEEVVPLLPKVTQFSTGVKFTRGSGQQPLPLIEEGPLYRYEAPEIPDRCGPDPPTIQEICSNGYLQHVRAENDTEKAGGYTSTLPCLRALQDALSGLYHAS
uniref:CDK-activating kinase assembly factor MAT1 n=2 Tax=Pararge aegeria TaxID=116150 RepID=S4PQU5_9NEOP